MPQYDYRCKQCKEGFSVERSMSDCSDTCCMKCGSEDVSRIWNMVIMATGPTADVGQGTSPGSKTRGGGCGSCCSTSCGTCS